METCRATRPPERPHDDKRLKTVLYIEDSPTNTALLRDVLADEFEGEAKLLSAPNAEIGLDVARACVPDLIVMDLHLPGMNGREAARLIKQSPAIRHIPIVSLSATGPRRAGFGGPMFEHHLPKPIDIGELVRVLRSFLSPTGSSAA